MRARAIGLAAALALVGGMLLATPAQAKPIDEFPPGTSGDREHPNALIKWGCNKKHRHDNGECRGFHHSHKSDRHRVQRKADLVDPTNGVDECDLLDVTGTITLCQAFDAAKRRARTGADAKSSDGVVGLWWVEFTQRAFSYEWWQLDKWDQYNSHQGAQAWFDGVHVWFDSSRGAPHPGYHQCWADRSLLVDVEVTHCWEQWTTDGNGDTFVRAWDEFQSIVLIKGVPLWNNIYMHANIHDNGAMTYWLSDINADGKRGHAVRTRYAHD